MREWQSLDWEPGSAEACDLSRAWARDHEQELSDHCWGWDSEHSSTLQRGPSRDAVLGGGGEQEVPVGKGGGAWNMNSQGTLAGAGGLPAGAPVTQGSTAPEGQ